MAGKRIVLPLLSVWEICRFLFLIIILSRFLSGGLFPDGDALVLVLLLGNGSLLVPAGALYLFITKKHSTSLVLVLCIAKITGLFTCLLALGSAAAGFFRSLGELSAAGPYFFEGAGLFIIFLMDLIFLVRLLSLKVEEK